MRKWGQSQAYGGVGSRSLFGTIVQEAALRDGGFRLREVDSSSKRSRVALENELRGSGMAAEEQNTSSTDSRVSVESALCDGEASVGTTIDGTSSASSAVILEQTVGDDTASAENEGQSSKGCLSVPKATSGDSNNDENVSRCSNNEKWSICLGENFDFQGQKSLDKSLLPSQNQKGRTGASVVLEGDIINSDRTRAGSIDRISTIGTVGSEGVVAES